MNFKPLLITPCLLGLLFISPPTGGEEPPAANPAAPTKPAAAAPRPANPKLVKLPFAFHGLHAESTPLVFKGQAVLVENLRDWDPKKQNDAYLYITDLATGNELARFGVGYSFASGFVDEGVMNVFAVKNQSDTWTQDIYRFWSKDLKTWEQAKVITRDGDEHLFNSSVCRDGDGFLMAYESNKPRQWSFRLARSKDLLKWDKIPDLEFSDVEGKSVLANPTIRHVGGWYYLLIGTHCGAGPARFYKYQLPETKYVTLIMRSKDLITWDLSPAAGPMLDPAPGEGVNNTDADLFEFEGNTFIYYMTGDQTTWATVRVAMYAGPMQKLLEAYFPEGVAGMRLDAKARRYIYLE